MHVKQIRVGRKQYKQEGGKLMKKMMMSIFVIAMSMMLGLTLVPGSLIAADKMAWDLGVGYIDDFQGDEPVVTVTGKVVKVEKMPGAYEGVQLRLITEDKDKYLVMLGPKWFISNQKIKFMAGDMLDVRGKKIATTIIASEVSKGDWTMKLRNEEDGLPVWQCCFPRKK
jgi:hypothetical protein